MLNQYIIYSYKWEADIYSQVRQSQSTDVCEMANIMGVSEHSDSCSLFNEECMITIFFDLPNYIHQFYF